MHFKNLIFFFTTLIVFASCESNDVVIDTDNLLLGSWVKPVYNEDTTSFTRSNTLPKESYGIAFKKNEVFIEHSSGFCGTPPLVFSDYEGNFTKEETLIKLDNYLYQNNFQWRIVSLTETELIVKREFSEQEIEHRALMDLYNELYELAYSETCSNISYWTFTAFGAKACGGPQGYIAYSTKIDTVSFLEKIEAYSEAEKAFNVKWNIASDCSIINPPISVECQNGYPVLIY